MRERATVFCAGIHAEGLGAVAAGIREAGGKATAFTKTMTDPYAKRLAILGVPLEELIGRPPARRSSNSA